MIIVSQNTFYFILEEDVYIFDHTWKYMTILHITYIRIVSQYHILTLSETRNLWSVKRRFIMPGSLAWAQVLESG